MIGLIVFGTWLEEIWGSKRFFQYYMVTGIGAGILFMGVDYFEKSAMAEGRRNFFISPDPIRFRRL